MTESDIPDGGAHEDTTVVEHLKEGQNFYDQPPFKAILNYVMRRYDGSSPELPQIPGLRSDITHLLSNFATIIESIPGEDSENKRRVQSHYGVRFMSSLQEYLPDESKIKYEDSGYKQGLDNAMREVIGRFSPHDGWRRYVWSSRDDAFYLPDGTYRIQDSRDSNATGISLPLTWVSWLARERRREAAIAQGQDAQAIADALLEGKTTAEAVHEKGTTRGRRRGRWHPQPPR